MDCEIQNFLGGSEGVFGFEVLGVQHDGDEEAERRVEERAGERDEVYEIGADRADQVDDHEDGDAHDHPVALVDGALGETRLRCRC